MTTKRLHDGPFRVPAFLLLALAWLALGGLAQALQEPTRFQAARDLDGYPEAQLSEFGDLYNFDEFERWNGQRVSGAELGQIRERWSVERDRVENEVARLEADPAELSRFFLRRKLVPHPYFSRIRLNDFPTHDPFEFLIQPPRSGSNVEETVIEFLGPKLLELEAIFVERVAGPLGLKRRSDRPLSTVIVLEDRREYDRYVRSLTGPALYFAQAQYDAELDAVVTFIDLQEAERDAALVRRPILHEMVHGLRVAYSPVDEAPELQPWFDEGLAGMLSSLVDLPENGNGPRDHLAVMALATVIDDRNLEAGCLLPVEELAAIGTYDEIHDRMDQRATSRGFPPPEYSTALRALYGLAGVWMHYLDQEQRDPFRGLTLAMLSGRPGPAALRGAFGEDLSPLNDAFLSYVRTNIGDWTTGNGADLDASFRLSDKTEENLGRMSRERSVGLAALGPDKSEPEVRFALALAEARRGAYGEALRAVQALRTYSTAGELTERVAREESRLAGMVELRIRFLEHLRVTGRKLNLVVGDQRLLAEVLEVDPDYVALGENRLDIERLPLDEIDAQQLLRAMKNRKSGFDRHWLFGYPHLLAGDGAWKRFVGDDTEQERSLRADAAEDYGHRLATAEAARLLEQLSEGGQPETPELGASTLEVIRVLWDDFGQLELVQDRRAPLVHLAYKAQATLFESEGLPSVVHGELQPLGDGRVLLRYSFDEEEQGQDFVSFTYLEDQRWEGSIPAAQSTPLHVMDGALEGFGAVCVRHVLEFEGRQTVRLRFLYRTPQRAYDTRVRTLLGICDDGQRGYIAMDTQGGLSVSRRGGRSVQQVGAAANTQVYMNTEHLLELEHDGQEKVVSRFDGQFVAEAPCADRLNGGVFIWSNTDCDIEVVELEIEATLSPGSLRLARAEWVEARLAELGIQ